MEPSIDRINNILVVGAGAMGSQIGMVCSLSGYNVVIHDIDVNYQIQMYRYKETGDESAKPKESVAEKYEKGELGRKTGKGWYEYDEQGQKV